MISSETISLLQSLLWPDIQARQLLESHGISIMPSNFYSSTPSLTDIESSEHLE